MHSLKKKASLKRIAPGAQLPAHGATIARKNSGDTTSTVDITSDRLELLEEPGSSIPHDEGPRRVGIVENVDHLEDDETAQDSDIHDGERTAVTIKWIGKADRVYVTGSFSHWRKKIQLSLQDDKQAFCVVLSLKPGTHRLKFDVDGVWKLSDDLAVATDSSGNFVNYIDVAEEDLTLTRGTDSRPSERAKDNDMQSVDNLQRWTSQIPSFIQRAVEPEAQCLETQSLVPPSLPPHLEKVILNTSNERKDDHSVLPQPNHVMLNHLAASSIRNGVLAVSASTRYRKKYVTTILYRPAVA